MSSKTAVITDGNDVVLRLLERNIPYGAPDVVAVSKLMWGYKGEIASVVAKFGEPDVIIGADVILWPDYVDPLLLTIRWLLSVKPRDSRCYISYVQRAVNTTVGDPVDLIRSVVSSNILHCSIGRFRFELLCCFM